ncbi:uncharacterized protein LOC122258573 [Penaeus japonicus]|uniref:uncharacterized protein LOC122258573 n=1 Tax=Penaeus japonicus TaxID=27405 RepID=UPI001C7165EA|nr:uncharacterized protein LOC122258573 [Penaeus japonicus]
MYIQILLACATCACVASAQTYEALGVLQPETPRELGKHEGVVAATIDILPEIARVLKEFSARMARSQDDPFDSQNIFEILMAFMPLTRKILFAVAEAEGRIVSEEELQRLDRAEEILPSALNFILELQGSEFFGFDGPAAEKAPASDTASVADTKVSGSFVRTPHARGVFIHHG